MNALTFSKAATIAALALSLGACTVGGDDDSTGTPTETPDAAPLADAGPEACTADPDYGDVGLIPEEAGISFVDGGATFYLGTIGSDTDLLRVELYKQGIFSGGFTAGDYQITGAETNYKTCALCVFVMGDAEPDGSGGDPYYAQSGTMTLTEVGEPGTGRFKVTLTNIVLAHVKIEADFTSTVLDDGCTSAIGNVSTDQPIDAN